MVEAKLEKVKQRTGDNHDDSLFFVRKFKLDHIRDTLEYQSWKVEFCLIISNVGKC